MEYLTDYTNFFDVLIIANWSILGSMRFLAVDIFPSYLYKGKDDIETRNTMLVLIYMFLYCAQICILWARIATIFRRSRFVGPFIGIIASMMSDIMNWMFVLSIFYMGFVFGLHFIVGPDIKSNEDCWEEGQDSYDLYSSWLIAEYVFILLLGQSEWGAIEPNKCIVMERSIIIKFYVWIFAMLGTILLLNLLIAMMLSQIYIFFTVCM